MGKAGSFRAVKVEFVSLPFSASGAARIPCFVAAPFTYFILFYLFIFFHLF